MLKRLLLLCLISLAPTMVRATDFTDIWYIPAESGWGVNVVQSNTFMFVTFFIYGADKKPTWYSANLSADATGAYSGKLYATTGTYYAMPWNPADLTQSEVGTASFQPTSNYTANLTYVLTAGSITVNKAIQRQTLTVIPLSGLYIGGQAGQYAGANCVAKGSYTDTLRLQAVQTAGPAITLSFTYDGSGLSCTMAGTMAQFGKVYAVPAATYQCRNGLNTTAIIDELRATSLGIEGHYTAADLGNGCSESAAFSAVLR
jgi:hypothetical protein